MESVCLPLSNFINKMSFINLMIMVMKVMIILIMDPSQQIHVGGWILADPEKPNSRIFGPAPGGVAEARTNDRVWRHCFQSLVLSYLCRPLFCQLVIWPDPQNLSWSGLIWQHLSGRSLSPDIGFGESVVFLFLRDRNGQRILGLPFKGTLKCFVLFLMWSFHWHLFLWNIFILFVTVSSLVLIFALTNFL